MAEETEEFVSGRRKSSVALRKGNGGSDYGHQEQQAKRSNKTPNDQGCA